MSVEPVASAPNAPTVRVTLFQLGRRLASPSGPPRRNRRRAARTARAARLAEAPPDATVAVDGERFRAEA